MLFIDSNMPAATSFGKPLSEFALQRLETFPRVSGSLRLRDALTECKRQMASVGGHHFIGVIVDLQSGGLGFFSPDALFEHAASGSIPLDGPIETVASSLATAGHATRLDASHKLPLCVLDDGGKPIGILGCYPPVVLTSGSNWSTYTCG